MSTVTPRSIDPIRRATTSQAAVRALKDRLQTARRILIGYRIGVYIALAVTVAAICLAASATADLFLELSQVWRASWIMFVVLVLAVGGAIGWKRWIAAYTLSQTAVDAERRLSQFGQRLRTTLDYEPQNDDARSCELSARLSSKSHRACTPASASPSLLNSLNHDTHKLAEETEWGDVVDVRPMLGSLLCASVVVTAWIAALMISPEFRIAAARSILIPLEYTTVAYSPQSATIRPGESVTINATVSGRPIDAAQLRHRPKGAVAEWVIVDLVPDDDGGSKVVEDASPKPLRGKLTATMEELTQDTEFEVIAGPRLLPSGLIRVLQPLTLEKSTANIQPPAYTGRTQETLESLDLKVLEGSTVELLLEFNRAAVEVKLLPLSHVLDQKIPAHSDVPKDVAMNQQIAQIPLSIDGNTVKATLADVRQSVSLQLTAHTDDGMSLDPAQINLRVQLDRKPEVKFLEPAAELVVTPTTEVEIIVEAVDDLGLRKMGVMYQVNSGPLQTLLEQDAHGSNEQYRLSSRLLLEQHGLTHQDAVNYYAFAEDDYFGQARRTITPLRFIDIRPYKLEFQVVDGGSCNGCSVTLEELIARQRHGLSQAFRAGEQPLAKQTMSRLSESQEELLDATHQFAAGMAARGAKLPSVDEAATQMETAIESLDGMKLPNAVTAEQQALAALIRARENVRQFLKQSSSQSASACRKFDREQRQKLRMPEKKKSEQQQLAQARQKLEELAQRERKWSPQAKQCCDSASSSSGKPGQSKSTSSNDSQRETSQSRQDPQAAPTSESASKPQEQAKTPSAAEVAADQQQMQAEFAQIQKQLEKLNQAGQAAQEQGRQAAESMQQGLTELQKQAGSAAFQAGERSAEQLEQLSAHLAAMNARDFGQRLDEAQKLAQQLASRQESLEQKVRSRSDSGQTPAAKSAKPKSAKQGAADTDPANSQETTALSKAGLPAANRRAETSLDVKPVPRHDGRSETREGSPDGRNDSDDDLSINGLARDQRALATRTGMLADLLDGLRRDASLESASVGRKLEQLQSENPPREVAAGMNQTSDDLLAGRLTSAHRGAVQARERLQELCKSLGAARGEYTQPQLKELMALEEQLAQLQQQLKRQQRNGEDPTAVAQKWQQLEPRLDKVASADQRLAEALRHLRDGAQQNAQPNPTDNKPGEPNASSNKSESSSAPGGKEPLKPGAAPKPAQFAPTAGPITPEGFYSWLERADDTGIRHVSKVIQARIQEAILAAALMDTDQPVPPAYKELVEKYYRALSDDLR